MGTFTAQEITDLLKQYKQKPGESLSLWLIRLFDSRGMQTMGSPREMIQLNMLANTPAIRQISTIEDRETGYERPWRTIPEAMEQLKCMAAVTAIFSNHADAPKDETFTPAMQSRLIKNAPLHMKGLLLALLSGVIGKMVWDATITLGHMDTMGEWHSGPKAHAVQDGQKKQPRTNKARRREMFFALLKSGTPKDPVFLRLREQKRGSYIQTSASGRPPHPCEGEAGPLTHHRCEHTHRGTDAHGCP
uniref:Uncharacterized protein n=1 Tax=Pelusios castaneus TaxID=367368 RepID=A0A8C8SXM2_9SAUR